MHRRERLERTIAGEVPDRLPVALWRHWPGDDQRAADLCRALVGFQRDFDWDLVVAAPASNFSVTDYGVQDSWLGTLSGERTILKPIVNRSLDWTDLRPYDPERGDTGKQVDCLHLLAGELEQSVPIVQVVYNPLAQAQRLAGTDLLLQHMRTRPDRFRTGLNTITESTLRFVDLLRRSTAVAGILYVIEMATYNILSEQEYLSFGLPYDRKIFDILSKDWWLNVIQVKGRTPMLHLFADFPAQVLSWSDQEEEPSLDRAPTDFRGAMFGGLGEEKHMHLGTPATIRDNARQIINMMGRRRLILGCGNPVPVTTPLSNLRAAREVVNPTL